MQMYQTDFICTYKLMTDERLQEQLYSIQLMQALGLDTWDDAAADRVLAAVITELQDKPVFMSILKLAKVNKSIADMTNMFSVRGKDEPIDDSIVFRLLFCYDYLDLMHRCVSDQLRHGKVTLEHCTALCQALANPSSDLDQAMASATIACASTVTE